MINSLSTCLIKFKSVTLDEDVEKLLKVRFIHESDKNYSKNDLQMHVENELAIKKNYAVLNGLLSQVYTIEADNKVSDNCKCPLATIQAAPNKKQTNTESLVKLLKLKIQNPVQK